MGFKGISWYSWLVGLFFSSVLLMIITQLVCVSDSNLDSLSLAGGMFCFDSVSYYLILLSCLLSISILFWLTNLSFSGGLMMGLSVVSSLFCYCCVHALWFWVFYEMSMVPLLVLLMIDSPYSERYIASWYLLGYVVFTSLPMLLCFFYLSSEMGGYDMRFWGESGVALYVVVCLVMAIMFITKMPLIPFHVWLPMVHAEASSPVSVCLSGYMMKLGMLGVCRFCGSILPSCVFSDGYIFLCFAIALLFFFSASRELDGKRWLAFLSLCHILVAAACLCVGGWLLGSYSFLYCLGHGLSAGVTFLLLWLVYEVSGTRNLFLLKNSISGSLLLRGLTCSCLCTVCSLPPTVQFFCEVFLAGEIFNKSVLFVLVFFLFLFFGGLIPLFLLGCVLTRHFDVNYGGGLVYSGSCSLAFLIFWSFLFFIIS